MRRRHRNHHPCRIGLATLLTVAFAAVGLGDAGDQEKAKAMLERAVSAVQKDQASALQAFTAGAEGFKDGAIYPFCFRLDDGVVVTGQTTGKDIRSFGGPAGQVTPVGKELFEAAQKPEGVVTEIAYMARKPPPADDTPVRKVSVIRRIGQIACGVGYYP